MVPSARHGSPDSKKFTLKNNKAITVSPLKNSDGDVIGYYLVGIDMDHPDMVNAMDGVNQTILLMLVLIVVLMGILMLFLWHASHKIVTQPIQSILSAIRQVEKPANQHRIEQPCSR